MYTSPVQFDEEGYKPRDRKIIKRNNDSELVKFLIEKGWFKSKTIATIVLLLISLSFMLMSVYFFTGGKVFGFNSSSSNQVSDNPYFINIPGVEEPIEIMPGEDVGEVLKKYRN